MPQKHYQFAEKFLNDTSAHGFKFLAKNDWIVRVFWLTAICVAWALMIWQCQIAVSDYLSYPVTTRVEIKTSQDVHMPSIVLCNANPIKRSMMELVLASNPSTRNDTNLRRYLDEGLDFDEVDTMQSSLIKSVIQNSRDKITEAMYTSSKELMSLATHRMHDSLLACLYHGEECHKMGIRQFEWRHAAYGNCFTIDSGDAIVVPFASPLFGLSLILFANFKEYIPNLSPMVGFIVDIQGGDIIPFPEMKGTNIGVGSYASIGLTKRTVKRLGHPYSQCWHSDNFPQSLIMYANYSEGQSNKTLVYSSDTCTMVCVQQLVYNNCKCVIASLATPAEVRQHFGEDIRSCDCDDQQDNNCYIKALGSLIENNECGKKCLVPCNEEKYHYNVNSVSFPHSKFVQSNINHWAKSYPRLMEHLYEDIQMNTLLEILGKNWSDFDKCSVILDPKEDSVLTNLTTPVAQMAKIILREKLIEFIRTNIVQIDVYFRSLEIISMTEAPDTTSQELFSGVGGMLGLMAGISVLTVAEFIFFICNFIRLD